MNLLPAPLQIGVIVIPLTAIGLLIWNHYEPGRAGPMPWLALVLGASVMTLWALHVRRLALHGQAIKGEIIRIKASDNPSMPLMGIVIFQYSVDGKNYRGEQGIPDRSALEGFHGGEPVHLVFDPKNPGRALIWGDW